MTLLLLILFEIFCKPGVIQGESTCYILSSTQNTPRYFELNLKDGVYKYVSKDLKDTSIIVIEKGEFYEVGKNKKIYLIRQRW